jgi:hypothetical protein
MDDRLQITSRTIRCTLLCHVVECKIHVIYSIIVAVILEEKVAEINPEMIWVLLQTTASELERQTEVCK